MNIYYVAILHEQSSAFIIEYLCNFANYMKTN